MLDGAVGDRPEDIRIQPGITRQLLSIDLIQGLTDKLEEISAGDSGCSRIRKIPGIGPVVSTAIVAAIGNGAAFSKGRESAAWLGVVLRQYSTGGKPRLLYQ